MHRGADGPGRQRHAWLAEKKEVTQGQALNTQTITGLILAGGLILFGLFAAALQLRGYRRLKATAILPSDERSYFRKRYIRRFLTGSLLVVIGGMIAGAYLSGMEQKVDALKADPNAPAEQRKLEGENKEIVQFWGGYWIVVIVLVFTVVGLAFADAIATRRYAMQRFRSLKEDHEVKLRRDLAVYVAGKQAGNRAGRMSHRPNGEDPS
jgi:hypothetical protein